MLIKIRDLEVEPLDFREEFAPGAIDLGEDVRQIAPLQGTGRVELVEEHHGKHETLLDIRLHGDVSTRLEVPCARCLEPVALDVERSYDLLYRPQLAEAGKEEISVTAAEAEVSYYQGDGLQLEDALREQVLLAVPLKTLCSPGCKGLCAQCGKNLNEGTCGCEVKTDDIRWTGLKDLRNKLEQ